MKQTRGRWVDLFADYHARIEIVYIEPSFDRLLQHNKRAFMIAQVLNSYETHLEFLRRLVCDLSDEQMVAQPNYAPNHPAWTIGHLVYSCQAMGGELGIPVWLTDDWEERFGTGSTPVADAVAYPDKEALLRALDGGKDRLAAALLSMGETGLAAPLPDLRYRDRFPTLGHAVVHILSGHTALHLGQLTVWRRAMGLKIVAEPLDEKPLEP